MVLNNNNLTAKALTWSTSSWREKPIQQAPFYKRAAKLIEVEKILLSSPGLVSYAEIVCFKQLLIDVCEKQAIILQLGECAETIKPFSEVANYVSAFHSFWSGLSKHLTHTTNKNTIVLGRIGGQLAKPRSKIIEQCGALALPSYRGDIINNKAYNQLARQPNPKNMLLAYGYSAAVLKALARLDARSFVSHEALLLPYEEALTRTVENTNIYYASSAHMLWIGERTRQYDSAHIEFCRGLTNPVGIKISRHMSEELLLMLIEKLNPLNEKGKLVLICRFGAQYIEQYLPPLIKAVEASCKNVIWLCDPMHGNNCIIENQKTRYLHAIKSETRSFFAIHRRLDTYAGGVHIEATYDDVAECIDGDSISTIEQVKAGYKSYCDPRLNKSQAEDYISFVAKLV